MVNRFWIQKITTELCSPEPWESWVFGKSSPFMAELFRSVNYYWLLVFLEHDWMIFPETVGNVILPVDELIFFREVGFNHQPDP